MEIKLEVQNAATASEEKQAPKQKALDAQGRAYATGKRKTAIARVWLKPGKGKITVNNLTPQKYFQRDALSNLILTPFAATDTDKKYDVTATVTGGGKSSQADAIKHAISKALADYNEEAYRKTLRTLGFLTRDSRVVERKKYGHKKARKSFQFSKR